ncbi:conserved hypothetical protein [Altererythrobacter sp. B11]|uniref:hypothetical protein n=1 Tax=Altererythrobacter sp. B11 TaxID=2060312 RepID=UPI000DC70811|nr:hypothetical protein [Altererythrobacter sp. B11]BBC72521.1 conserved hypothetical protein [Altererythrobacter sp. B11]
MALKDSRLCAASAVAAAISLVATPAAAVDLRHGFAHAAVRPYDPDAGNVAHRGYRRHHDGGGIDGGDIVAGILAIGGIALLASAASNDRDRRAEPPPPPPRMRYPQGEAYPAPGAYRSVGGGTGAMDRAVSACLGEMDRRGEAVDAVENASRTPEGWNVAGTLRNGSDFSCWLDDQGRIADVSLGEPTDHGGYAPAAPARGEDNQWSDDYYNRARANLRYSTPDVGGPADGNVDGDLAPEGGSAW